MHPPVRIAAPATAPVSLEEVKRHCRVDHNEEDTILSSYINAAVSYLDGWGGVLGRCLVSQTWQQKFPSFHGMRLVLVPVASIVSVKYYDADNVQQTLDAGDYMLVHDAPGASLVAAPGIEWPDFYSRPDAVTVEYVAGTPAEQVPASIKVAIMLLVGHWYQNREASASSATGELPFAVDALIAPYRRVGL